MQRFYMGKNQKIAKMNKWNYCIHLSVVLMGQLNLGES